MKKRFTTLVLSVLLALAGALGFLSFSASADAAPPPPPVGSNIPPGGLTNVRMMSETVTLDVQASTALVEAVFYMRNLGEKDEDMLVRFPLYHDGYSIYSNECGDFVLVLRSSILKFRILWFGLSASVATTPGTYQDAIECIRD